MISRIPIRAAVAAIRIYRSAISPFMEPACRFTPSCSLYAEEALARYGVVKGGLMTLRRLLRCHPLCSGGVDPVR